MAANMSWTRRRQQAAQHEARIAPSSDLFVLEHVDGYNGVRPCHACPFHALIGCCKVFSKETHVVFFFATEIGTLSCFNALAFPSSGFSRHVQRPRSKCLSLTGRELEDCAECLKTCLVHLLHDDVALVIYVELLCTDLKSTDGRYVAKSNRALQVLEMP